MVDGRMLTSTKSVGAFWSVLEEYNFFKISKSHIVNLDHVVSFHQDTNHVVLEGYVILDVARRKKKEFLTLLKIKNRMI